MLRGMLMVRPGGDRAPFSALPRRINQILFYYGIHYWHVERPGRTYSARLKLRYCSANEYNIWTVIGVFYPIVFAKNVWMVILYDFVHGYIILYTNIVWHGILTQKGMTTIEYSGRVKLPHKLLGCSRYLNIYDLNIPLPGLRAYFFLALFQTNTTATRNLIYTSSIIVIRPLFV